MKDNKNDINRLYLTRKGRGFASIEDCVNEATRKLEEYIGWLVVVSVLWHIKP